MGELVMRRRETAQQQGSGYQHGTWEDLFWHIDHGDVSTEYAVGETLTLNLGTNNTPEMQIIAFNTDTLSDSSNKAAVTFLSKTTYKTTHRMNPARVANTDGTGTLGGWEKCEMRDYLANTVFALIPADIASRIVSVKKYSKIFLASTEAASNNKLTNDKIWIPNYRELNVAGAETSGPVYSSFFASASAGNNARIKTRYNSTTKQVWYLRTAYSATAWYNIATTGAGVTAAGTSAIYYPIGFCVN